MTKLELTEPRMHAMAVELKAFGGWTLETCHKAVAAVIAAANSVPEGVPVGTIARRPDGKWIAVRTTGNAATNWWTYSYTGVLPVEHLREPDADSWPQIRPDEWPVSKVYSTEEAADALGVDLTPHREPCQSYNGPVVGYGRKVSNTSNPPEPRVLPSLDCEEARDGTVWQARYELVYGNERTPGWKFQHTSDGWVYERGDRVLSPEFLTDRGPYTEVISDPS